MSTNGVIHIERHTGEKGEHPSRGEVSPALSLVHFVYTETTARSLRSNASPIHVQDAQFKAWVETEGKEPPEESISKARWPRVASAAAPKGEKKFFGILDRAPKFQMAFP